MTIVDDSVYEADEQFYVVLGTPQTGRLGPQDKAVVTLTNREDGNYRCFIDCFIHPYLIDLYTCRII